MEVSGQANNYQMMQMYQKQAEPTPMPIVRPEPQEQGFNEDIYEASSGNLINGEDGTLALTPQGETNIANAQTAQTAEEEAAAQAQKDSQREMGVNYLDKKSTQSQVEIYLSVAADEKVELGGNDTADIIESLRDVQKQNNAVEAYATYQENQQNSAPVFY